MTSGYLSIGEMAKLKGLSVKSLRYYEEIGILKPAYINPKTKYRYYLKEQLFTLDLIWLCLELDLPLKSLLDYKSNQEMFDFDRLIQEGKRRALDRQCRIEKVLRMLTDIEHHLKESESLIKASRTIPIDLPKQVFLQKPLGEGFFQESRYIKAITDLYEEIALKKLDSLMNYGLYIRVKKGVPSFFAFLEISENLMDQTNTVTIPAQTMTSYVVFDRSLNEVVREALASEPSSREIYIRERFQKNHLQRYAIQILRPLCE